MARATGVATATRMMADDHYGWFERVERGVYALTPKGAEERGQFDAGDLIAPAPAEETAEQTA